MFRFILKKLNIDKNKYRLNEEKIERYSLNKVDTVLEDNTLTDDILDKLTNKKPRKILVYALGSEPNLNYEYLMLKEEKVYIEAAAEMLKDKFENTEVVILINKKNNEIDLELNGNIKVLKVCEKWLLDKGKLLNKLFGKGISEDEVISLELLSLVYIGKSKLSEALNIILSVTGDAINSNKVIEVPSGIKIREVFTLINGDEDKLKQVISGGIITGQAIYDLDAKVNPMTKGLVFNSKIRHCQDEACIRCAKCLRDCPVKLNPIKLNDAWKKRNIDEFIALRGKSCIDCGLCSYICPSNIQLSHNIKMAKEYVNKKM